MEDIVKKFQNIKNVMTKGCDVAFKSKNPREIEKWIKELKIHIKLLSSKSKMRMPVYQANAVTDTLRLLMRFEIVLSNLLQKLQSSARAGGNVSNQVSSPRSGHPTVDEATSDQLLSDRVKWRDLDSAFENRIRTGVIINITHKDLISFFNDAKRMFLTRVRNANNKYENLRITASLSCNFIKQGENIEDVKHFQVTNFIVLPASDLENSFDENIKDQFLNKIEEFEGEQSGWSLTEILNLNLNFNKYVPLVAGYHTFIGLPKQIKDKRAVLNIQNKDKLCFLWSVTAALYPAPPKKNPVRTTSYPDCSEVLKHHGIDFPFELQNIRKFEKMNDLCIHIYGLDQHEDSVSINVLYLSKYKSPRDTIHLLLVQGSARDSNVDDVVDFSHFCLIKNLSRLCRSQISNHEHKLYFCDRCLNHFSEKPSYTDHKDNCYEINKCRMILPTKKEFIKKFENFKYKE